MKKRLGFSTTSDAGRWHNGLLLSVLAVILSFKPYTWAVILPCLKNKNRIIKGNCKTDLIRKIWHINQFSKENIYYKYDIIK